jgi:hypothetical protein
MYNGHFSFSMLTTFQQFSLNEMTKKRAQCVKGARENVIVLFHVHKYQNSRPIYHLATTVNNKTTF